MTSSLVSFTASRWRLVVALPHLTLDNLEGTQDSLQEFIATSPSEIPVVLNLSRTATANAQAHIQTLPFPPQTLPQRKKIVCTIVLIALARLGAVCIVQEKNTIVLLGGTIVTTFHDSLYLHPNTPSGSKRGRIVHFDRQTRSRQVMTLQERIYRNLQLQKLEGYMSLVTGLFGKFLFMLLRKYSIFV